MHANKRLPALLWSEFLGAAAPAAQAQQGNPAYPGDTKFMTTSAGIDGMLGANVALSFAYYKLSSRAGIKEDGVAGSVSVKF